MEVTGRVQKIFDIQTFSSGFRKREVVVLTQEQYPQPILIEFTQDRVDLVNSIQVGEEVRVSIGLRGREWTNPEGVVKYFNSINGWRIDKITSVTQTPTSTTQMPPQPPTSDVNLDKTDNEADDLPF